jgi:hypothetical protein
MSELRRGGVSGGESGRGEGSCGTGEMGSSHRHGQRVSPLRHSLSQRAASHSPLVAAHSTAAIGLPNSHFHRYRSDWGGCRHSNGAGRFAAERPIAVDSEWPPPPPPPSHCSSSCRRGRAPPRFHEQECERSEEENAHFVIVVCRRSASDRGGRSQSLFALAFSALRSRRRRVIRSPHLPARASLGALD